MPLSHDPAKRQRQLANLNRGATPRSPAPSGNRRALRHGGYAEVTRERLGAKVREVYDALAADAPLRAADGGLPRHDSAAVRLLADCLCRLESVSEYLDRRGWQTDAGELRSAVELEARLRREAADHLDALGMTPRSRARLGLDVARGRDLAAEWAAEAEAEEIEDG